MLYTAIVEDADDLAFYKTNDDGLLTDVYVKVVDETEGVPGTPTPAELSRIEATDGVNQITAINPVLTAVATEDMTVSVQLKVLNNAGGWTDLKTLTFNISEGNRWDTTPQTVTGLAAGQYKLVCGSVETLVTVTNS